MVVTLITNRLGAYPWDHGPLVAAIAHEIARRGHAISLITDSVEDPAALPPLTLHAFRPYEQTATAFPIRFPRWAARRAAAAKADHIISLTHRVAAPMWMPIDRPARDWRALHVATRGPVSLAATFARTPGAFLPSVGRVGGPNSPLSPPPFSLLAPASADERASVRAAIRALLNIPDDHRLLLASATEAVGRRLDPLLASLVRRDDHILAILARDTFTIERRAAAIGGESLLTRLRILTLTGDIRPLLLAADVAVTLMSRLNRFAHDAARLGTRCETATQALAPPQTPPPLTPAELVDSLISPRPAA